MAKAYRLPVPIKPETRDAIERLANATNASIGATAAQYLDELAPHFLKLAEAFELLKTDPDRGVQLLQKAGFEAQQQLTEQQLSLIEGEGK